MITLKHLQNLINEKIKEQKSLLILKEEVVKTFGSAVLSETNLSTLAESVNDRLDVLERTGKNINFSFKPSVLLRFKSHPNKEVRKFVARMLPLHLAENFKNDSSDVVRHAIAKRLPLSEVKLMIKKYSNDDQLYEIYRSRIKEEKNDSYAKKLSLASKKTFDFDLSDEWYAKTAHKAIMDYGCQFDYETLWADHWVRNYCSSMKAISGVECDAIKLQKEIKKQLVGKYEY